jgi:hypothetical protein
MIVFSAKAWLRTPYKLSVYDPLKFTDNLLVGIIEIPPMTVSTVLFPRLSPLAKFSKCIFERLLYTVPRHGNECVT